MHPQDIDGMPWGEEWDQEEWDRQTALGWYDGFHVDREGNEYQLTEMTPDHLRNTIEYFKDRCDTRPLKAELLSRGLPLKVPESPPIF